MGWTVRRATNGGKERWRACYRDVRGVTQSAGTYSTEAKAEKAWQRAEARAALGRAGDPRRGKQKFEAYVTDKWLPNHVMEVSTREGYTYQIAKHVTPWFGGMRMNAILPSDVREWITHLGKEKVSPATQENLRNILSAIFTTALNDGVIFLHPCERREDTSSSRGASGYH